MSLIQALTGTQQRVQFIQKDTGVVIVIDATVNETHSRDSTPTEFEVENGDTISDNIIVKPFALEIQGIISDTPLSVLNAALTTAVSAIVPPIALVGATAGSALFSAIAETDSPSVVAYKQIRALQENKQPFDVLTTLNRYTNMFIKSLSIPRDANTGQVLMFNISLVELLLVSPQTVNLQIFKDADLSAALANQGRQEMLDPGIAQAAKAGRIAGQEILGVK